MDLRRGNGRGCGTVLQCRHSSLELSTSALAFIKSHPLMHDCVDTLDSRPLYFTKHDEAFTRLAVDYVVQYTLFFLASSKLSTAPSLYAVYILNCMCVFGLDRLMAAQWRYLLRDKSAALTLERLASTRCVSLTRAEVSTKNEMWQYSVTAM